MALDHLSDEERADLVAFLDGELDEASARALQARLAADPLARAEADALRRTWQLLDHLPRPAPSPASASRTLQRLSQRLPALRMPARRRVWPLFLVWVVCVLLAAAVGYLVSRLARHYVLGPRTLDARGVAGSSCSCPQAPARAPGPV